LIPRTTKEMIIEPFEIFGPHLSSRRLVFCYKLAPQVVVDEGRRLGFQGEMQRNKVDQQWRLGMDWIFRKYGEGEEEWRP
jgi:hypothetical protein